MLKINTKKRAQLSVVPYLVGVIVLLICYLLLNFSFSKYKILFSWLMVIALGISIYQIYTRTYLDLEFFSSHLVIREYSIFKEIPSRPVNHLEIPSQKLKGHYWDEKNKLLCFIIHSPNKEETTIKFSSGYLNWQEKRVLFNYLQNLLLAKSYNNDNHS